MANRSKLIRKIPCDVTIDLSEKVCNSIVALAVSKFDGALCDWKMRYKIVAIVEHIATSLETQVTMIVESLENS